ncbi:MAG: beta galactosidase jelly roll domain-containing protein [Thermoleophilaceae bacterium]|nr:beta galactosidase jelly roll domain-containing protein [Thermoleophilaceae bacterium]
MACVTLACIALTTPTLASAASPTPGAPYFNGQGDRYTVGGQWYFLADPTNDGIRAGYRRTKNFANWDPVSIPNAWNATDFSEASHAGSIGWYGTVFDAPKAPRGSQWILRFESVNYFARVYLNGKEIGRHEGAYVPFELPAQLLKKKQNSLVVRVDHRLTDKTVPPQETRESQVTGGWWNYGGILREVLLRRVKTLDLTDVAVRPRQACPKCTARIDVITTVTNLSKRRIKAKLVGNFGGQKVKFRKLRLGPHKTLTVVGQAVVPKPKLWEPLRPNLYPVSVLLTGGGARSTFRMSAGIRTVKSTPKGELLLNGRAVRLSGVSLHEADPNVGAAWTPAIRNQYLGWVKELGANLLRSHYPLHPATMEWADRNGVLTWVQAPVYRPRDIVLKRKAFRAKSVKAVSEMIYANRSHPSVMVWSLINEPVVNSTFYLQQYISAAWKEAKRLDPRGLTAIDVASSPRADLQHPAYRKVEVLGLNQYFGWYPGGGGSTKDRAAFGAYAADFHATYPKQALFVTEFGAEANHDGPADELGSYDFQTNFFIFHLREIAKLPFVNGMVAWLLRDYPVRPNWSGGNPDPASPFGAKGLIDAAGNRKPAFGEVERAFKNRPPFK